MVVVVALVVRFTEPAGFVPGFRMDALSALFYFSNWWQIHEAGNYFATTGPVSPLTHTWSLAVEEQFYLVWPLVVVAVLTVCRTRRAAVATVGAVAAGGAVASAVLMGVGYGSTSARTPTPSRCSWGPPSPACSPWSSWPGEGRAWPPGPPRPGPR
jgi:peptidoglycan/LPS O-acetylase OafA/YrhL